MKENRSFDHLFGALHDSGQPGVEALPADFTNPGGHGEQVSFFHHTNTCIAADPGHQSKSMRACVDGGKMDGFVENAANTTDTDGHFVMSLGRRNPTALRNRGVPVLDIGLHNIRTANCEVVPELC